MCEHDPFYRIENEENGGCGCPLCVAERGEIGACSGLVCEECDLCDECPFDGTIPADVIEDEPESMYSDSRDAAF